VIRWNCPFILDSTIGDMRWSFPLQYCNYSSVRRHQWAWFSVKRNVTMTNKFTVTMHIILCRIILTWQLFADLLYFPPIFLKLHTYGWPYRV
jgi:hypothetical protein